MKVCPECGYKDSPYWKPLFWKLYWEYMSMENFSLEYNELIPKLNEAFQHRWTPPKRSRKKCEVGNFWYHFEDDFYYYKISGKTRKMIHRFPKGFESMANRKLFEKTPSEKGQDDIFQQKLVEGAVGRV